MPSTPQAEPPIDRGQSETLNHVGITVADLNRSLAFWQPFLDVEPRWRRVLDGGYLTALTGYIDAVFEVSLLDLPGGARLELLEYRVGDTEANDMGTSRPGNVHIALTVDDIQASWTRAVRCGAVAVSPGPVLVTSGPNAGAWAAYLRDPDGVTVELLQPPETS